MNQIPKINERYAVGCVIYTIRHVDEVKGLVWIEPFPTRGFWPADLSRFLESNPILIPDTKTPHIQS
jgi:hypothetical protein